MSFSRWATAFAFTQIVEIPISSPGSIRRRSEAFGASAITHPIVWWVCAESGWRASWTTRTVVGELFAVIVEALYFGVTYGLRRGAIWSLIANGVSFGLVLEHRTV
jgi:hypothetical protein